MDWTPDAGARGGDDTKKVLCNCSEALDNAEPYVGVVNALGDDINTAGAISRCTN